MLHRSLGSLSLKGPHRGLRACFRGAKGVLVASCCQLLVSSCCLGFE